MQFNTYTAAGAHVACWLANNPQVDRAALAATLARYDVHEPLADGVRTQALRDWAERLRAVFESGAEAERAERADALLVAADCRPRLVRHGDGRPFHLHYAPVQAGLTARVKALTAGGLAHVIDEGGGSRLRTCQRAGCDTAFVDTSRNGRRRFCSLLHEHVSGAMIIGGVLVLAGVGATWAPGRDRRRRALRGRAVLLRCGTVTGRPRWRRARAPAGARR